MSLIDQNKEIARRWIEDFRDKNLHLANEIIAPKCIAHKED